MIKQIILMISFLGFFSQSQAAIQLGQSAPDFTLVDQHNKQHTLSDYQGQWVVVYFYPKDDTPGCTTEACSFRDAINHIIAKRAVVFGISLDDVESHQKFSKKNNLPFSILSDADGKVAKQYDSLGDYWVIKFAKRNSFIVNPAGDIVKIYKGVDPQTHVQKVLKDLSTLQK
ncbi:MAG: peroxiredoxin [Candidatus Thioglobus sp.]|nr:MAG: peroxiredoxin [Candidatus Thioglobus sp.]RUM80403.1 MAG: peroxiredoxin [Candidatus Thioglobus sp.]